MRVPAMRRAAVLRAVGAGCAASLVLAGCSSTTEDPSPSPSGSAAASDGTASADPTASPSASSTPDRVPTAATTPTMAPTGNVRLPRGVVLTAQGENLEFGQTATVEFDSGKKPETALDLKVTGARKGLLEDFSGFILDNDYKKRANYYYVDVTVTNVGKVDAGGAPIPIWGVNEENTLLPAVNFTTRFAPCASTPLPERFRPGTKLRTCLVYLAPDKGRLESLSYRPVQAFAPIRWVGEIDKARESEPKKKNQKKGQKKDGQKKRNP